jgi:hypothetical protein
MGESKGLGKDEDERLRLLSSPSCSRLGGGSIPGGSMLEDFASDRVNDRTITLR